MRAAVINCICLDEDYNSCTRNCRVDGLPFDGYELGPPTIQLFFKEDDMSAEMFEAVLKIEDDDELPPEVDIVALEACLDGKLNIWLGVKNKF